MLPRQRKKKITTREINATLGAIYHDEAGKKIDMKIHRAERRGWRRLLIGSIIFFGLIFTVSWLGIFFFSNFSGFGADNLKLEIAGDKKIVAGAGVEYEIYYKNNEDMPLASSEIGLFFPKAFVLSSSTPLLDDRNVLKVGTLRPGHGGSIKISGKFFAAEREKHVLQAALTYKPSNFNSTFQKIAKLEIEIFGSVFDGSLEGPDKISVGSDAEYELVYKNKSNETLKNLAIEAVLPADFMASSSTPAIDKNNRWLLEKLEAQAEGRVKLRGSFNSGAKGSRDISLKLGTIDKDGVFLALIEKVMTSEVIGGNFITTLAVNGSSNNGTVRWGQPLNYSLTYKNDGAETIYDAKLRMNIVALQKEGGRSIINWSSLVDTNNGRSSGETIVWTKKEISGLGQIRKGEQGTLNFSIDLIPRPAGASSAGPSYKDYKIEGVLEVEIARIGNLAMEKKMQANKITTFVDSDTEFSSQARYYNDGNIAVGSGPLPPRVGQKTSYKIYWKITNSMHELENIVVSADLGKNAVFSLASAEAGTVALDSTLKKVEWTLNRLPTSISAISASFDAALTPSAEDVGNIAKLLENIILTAKDKSTGGTITISAGDETTELKDDSYVTVGGRVQN